MIIVTILVFILVLSILVLIHEFGHFIMAKRSGIGVEEFGFGLPPRAIGKKIGGTIYSLNWLPFGGFVRLVGEDSTDKSSHAKDSFATKSVWQRSKVVVAGVVMNLFLGIFIYYIVVIASGFQFNFSLPVEHKFKWVNQTTKVLVADVNADSPAASAGIKQGDFITKIDGADISSISQLQSAVKSSTGKQLTFTVEDFNHNNLHNVVAVPKYSDQVKAPAIGVSLGELTVLTYSTLPQKIFSGFIHSYNMVDLSVGFLGNLIASSIKHGDIKQVGQNVSGPIGIAVLTSVAIKEGIVSVLNLMALLSLNLAIINILPVPALDGGRFFFILVEGITRRKVHPTFEKWVHTVGFVVLIALIILISYNDVIKLVNKQFPF